MLASVSPRCNCHRLQVAGFQMGVDLLLCLLGTGFDIWELQIGLPVEPQYHEHGRRDQGFFVLSFMGILCISDDSAVSTSRGFLR